VPGYLYRPIVTVAVVVIALDQLAKWAIVEWLGPGATSHRRELAGRLLAFEYVENTGAAFGLFAGRVWLISVLALAVAVLFVILLASELNGNYALQVAIGMILGGAIGNLIDRLRLGYVIDFIAIGTWPKFNVADSSITLGVAVVVLTLLRDERTNSIGSASSPERSRGIPMVHDSQQERNDGAC
jgi:signal peptidase II